MKHLARAAALAAAIAGAVSLFSVPAAGAAPLTNCEIVAGNGAKVDSLAVDLREEEVTMIELVDKFRKDNGLEPLISARKLDRPAAWASTDSAVRGFSPSDHVDSLGRGIATRFDQCGASGYQGVFEINYQRQGGDTAVSAADAMKFWTNSPVHRDILLVKGLTQIGIGLAYIGDYGHPAPTNRVHWTITLAG